MKWAPGNDNTVPKAPAEAVVIVVELEDRIRPLPAMATATHPLTEAVPSLLPNVNFEEVTRPNEVVLPKKIPIDASIITVNPPKEEERDDLLLVPLRLVDAGLPVETVVARQFLCNKPPIVMAVVVDVPGNSETWTEAITVSTTTTTITIAARAI